MENILSNKDFQYITKNDREFLVEFDKEICALGFERTEIGDFSRWGNKTIAYIKPKVKAKNYISKIFFDGTNILNDYISLITTFSPIKNNIINYIIIS